MAHRRHLLPNCRISRNALNLHKFNHRVLYNCYFLPNRSVFVETLFFTFQWLLYLSFIIGFLTIVSVSSFGYYGAYFEKLSDNFFVQIFHLINNILLIALITLQRKIYEVVISFLAMHLSFFS